MIFFFLPTNAVKPEEFKAGLHLKYVLSFFACTLHFNCTYIHQTFHRFAGR